MQTDFHNLTLSDFVNLPIGIRKDGSATPLFKNDKGEKIGLAGFKGDPNKTNYEIAEEAFMYYQRLIDKLKNKK